MAACAVCTAAGVVSIAWSVWDVHKATGFKNKAVAAIAFVPGVGRLGSKARTGYLRHRQNVQYKKGNYRSSRQYRKRENASWDNYGTVAKTTDRAALGWDVGTYSYGVRKSYTKRSIKRRY